MSRLDIEEQFVRKALHLKHKVKKQPQATLAAQQRAITANRGYQGTKKSKVVIIDRLKKKS